MSIHHYLFLICLSFLVPLTGTSQKECDPRGLKKAKSELAPFVYDGSKRDVLAYEKKENFYEIEVPLFIGEKYRFIFNTDQLPEPVRIEIYNKPKGKKRRELLFSNEETEATKNGLLIYEPERSRNMYVNYTVPASEEEKKGCIIFVAGYKMPSLVK